jgi:pyridoxamine 5'-phosphate oxidase-like protein
VDIDQARELGVRESGLAIVVAQRRDGSPYASVVNAGVLEHPVTSEQVVGFVARGGTRKLPNLRHHPRLTVVFRSGWEWVTIEGDAELAGPNDPLDGFDPDQLPRLLQTIYAQAVGGDPDEWGLLSAEMVDEKHTAVVIRPIRCYSSNP